MGGPRQGSLPAKNGFGAVFWKRPEARPLEEGREVGSLMQTQTHRGKPPLPGPALRQAQLCPQRLCPASGMLHLLYSKLIS